MERRSTRASAAWNARVRVGSDPLRQLGMYEDEVDAAKAYDKAAKELHHAPTLNFKEHGSLNPDRKGPQTPVTGTSRFRGVGWNKARRKWRVRISVNGRNQHVGQFADEISAAREYDRAVRRFKLNRPVNFSAGTDDTDDGSAAPVVSTRGSADDGDSIWDSEDGDVVEDEKEDDDGDDGDSDVDNENGLQQTESSLQPASKRSHIHDSATVAHTATAAHTSASTSTVAVPSIQDPLKVLQEVVTAAMVQARDKDHVERQRVAEAFAVMFKRHMQTEIRDFAERTITNSFVTMDMRSTQDRDLLLQMFIAAFIDSS